MLVLDKNGRKVKIHFEKFKKFMVVIKIYYDFPPLALMNDCRRKAQAYFGYT